MGRRERVAYIVAVEKYSEGRFPNVDYAKHDATEIKKVFKNTFGLEDHEIKELIDERALSAKFDNEIAYDLKHLPPESELYFYYVGHGFHDGYQNWLTCHDTYLESIEKTAIPLQDKILAPAAKANCKSALIFLDTCSKNLLQSVKGRSAIQQFSLASNLQFTNEDKYRAIFCSCSPGEVAYPSTELKHGIWTWYLLEALRGNVPEILDQELILKNDRLQKYLRESVKDHLKKFTEHKSQNPYLIVGAEDSFAIAKFENKSSSLSNVFLDLSPDYDKMFFRTKKQTLFKKHPAFSKKKGHYEPVDHNTTMDKKASDWTEEERKNEINDVYERCNKILKIKRSKMNKKLTDLDSDLFRYSITGMQDPEDYRCILVEKILRLRVPINDLPTDFDNVFLQKPEEIVIPFEKKMPHEELLIMFEFLEEKISGELDENEEKGFLSFLTSNGLSITIDHANMEIIISHLKTQGVVALTKVVTDQFIIMGLVNVLSRNPIGNELSEPSMADNYKIETDSNIDE